jgi:hypothetical protein
MKLGRVDQSLIAGILIMAFVIFSSFLEDREKLKYTQRPTIVADNHDTFIVAYKDTLNDDSLYLVKTKDHIPIQYFKKVATEVCFDNKCRLLDITVFWNITGRYLGFELSDGEFLSKYDHEPFVASEYERLNELLADPMLPFGDISFEKLIVIPETDADSLDGMSGATTEDLSKIVVKGAAYTTYTLWNIVYGPTKDFVAHLTEMQLTGELTELILKSPELSDKLWILNRIDQSSALGSKLTATLLDLISGDDFSLTYNAINALSSVHLGSDSLQLGLFSKYDKVNHSVQKMIIDKLMDVPYLHTEIVTTSRGFLDQLNGKQLADILLLYSKHSVDDLETCKALAKILDNENRYISQKAYKFLLGVEITDSLIIENLNSY